ncbi:MAG: flagellin [Campylobacterota bacterium]|nr:flagellin [Campylobacterota bacterium]
MGFRINTNIGAMNAHRNAANTNINLDKSLQSLSSGLRINTAADDASGLAIANSLRSQATGLGQSINNANDGIGVMQTADGALDEYENIINIVRTKAIQAASDGQNADSRMAIQRDITKLIEEAQNIAVTTQFNGQELLNGTFQNKSFHIGAYKDETVNISISNTQTNSIGRHVREEGNLSTSNGTVNSSVSVTTTGAILASDTTKAAGATTVAVAFDAAVAINGELTGISVAGDEAGQTSGSAWAKAKSINAIENKTGVHAFAETVVMGTTSITAGNIDADTTTGARLIINGINMGDIDVKANDEDGSLRNAINEHTGETGVVATIESGRLVLTSNEGREISLGTSTDDTAGDSDSVVHMGSDAATAQMHFSGTLKLTSGEDIKVTEGGAGSVGFNSAGNEEYLTTANAVNTADVTTRKAAEDTILTMDYALQQLDAIRSNIGSTQNQLESTIRNISVTQVNVTAAESQIRDVDFAAESANFAKHNILAQSGSYAMSQANAVQQNVMKLLQ